jgi:predicted RNA-binding protein YlqC (UPF0109 family)
MKQLLEFIVNSITGQKATIKEETMGDEIVYNLLLPKENIGKVIGRNGRVIKAIKKIMEARQVIKKDASRFSIKITEAD